MKLYLICQELILMLSFVPVVRKMNAESIFLISPGGGRNYTYSPVGVNATLECKVRNDGLIILWEVGDQLFESHSTKLNERGIYQSGMVPSSEGLASILVVFGNITDNNGSKVCCLLLEGRMLIENCTTIILYGNAAWITKWSHGFIVTCMLWIQFLTHLGISGLVSPTHAVSSGFSFWKYTESE